ncbi:MAG: biotin transporter BioY [Clostridia bacterium]|nr:biotin transporter BioY [Clostridia bacterium]
MKNNNKKNIRDIAVAAIFTAIICVSAWVTVPMPYGVPVTLQTLSVSLCGYCLGTKKSLMSITAYILIGLAGVPVFSNFNGGAAALFGKTGGFIFGFIFLIVACGITEKIKRKWMKIPVGIIGLILCHMVGAGWFSFLTKTGVISSALMVSAPFILKDTVCVILAYLLSERLKKIENLPI